MNRISGELLQIAKEIVGTVNNFIRDQIVDMSDKDLKVLIESLQEDGYLKDWSPDDTGFDYRRTLAGDIVRLPPQVLKKHGLGE